MGKAGARSRGSNVPVSQSCLPPTPQVERGADPGKERSLPGWALCGSGEERMSLKVPEAAGGVLMSKLPRMRRVFQFPSIQRFLRQAAGEACVW